MNWRQEYGRTRELSRSKTGCRHGGTGALHTSPGLDMVPGQTPGLAASGDDPLWRQIVIETLSAGQWPPCPRWAHHLVGLGLCCPRQDGAPQRGKPRSHTLPESDITGHGPGTFCFRHAQSSRPAPWARGHEEQAAASASATDGPRGGELCSVVTWPRQVRAPLSLHLLTCKMGAYSAQRGFEDRRR